MERINRNVKSGSIILFHNNAQHVLEYLPQVLDNLRENGYEVVYWPTQGEDRRDHLAGNMQVDLVSGYREGDRLPLREAEITVFRTAVSGEEQTYRICLTSVAPSSLREELESFFSSVGQEEISGILMETHVRQPDVSPALAYAAGGLALTSAFLLAALILVLRRFRKGCAARGRTASPTK